MVKQLKKQLEVKFCFVQELLSQLEDNVQNVSAKAASSEVLCNANQVSISPT